MSDRATIPSTLKKDRFRFIKVKEGEKRPIEKNWQEKNNYKYNDPELIKHLRNGGNYGVVGGYGDLVIIDCDKEKAAEKVRENLPETLTVQSGSGNGWHFYYISEDLDQPIRLSDDSAGDIGDVQAKGKMAVGPKSLHPSGNRYKIENYRKVAKVSAEEIKSAFEEFLVDYSVSESNKSLESEYSENGSIRITDVVDVSNLKKRGSEFQGSHPVHGSETGQNFCVNTEKNVWHCFRHGTGGGALSWIGVKEGIIDCEDCVKNSDALKNNFSQVLDVAEEEYDVDLLKYGFKRIGFDEEGKFKPGLVGKYLVDNYDFVTLDDSQQLYCFEDGFWKPKGDIIVKKEFNRLVEPEEFRKSRLASVLEYVRTSKYVKREDFEQPERKVNLQNGVFDLETDEFLEHDKKFNFTYKIPVEFDEHAECPAIMGFLNDIVDTEEQVEKILEMVGYCMLSGNPNQKAFMLAGNGRNGKTVLIDLIKELIGRENMKKLSLQSLQKDFDKHFLNSKLVMYHDDIPARKIGHTVSANLKSLTGNSTFSAEIKRGDRYDFQPFATPVFAANQVPPTEDETNGFFRRWVFLEFPFSFVNHPDPDNRFEKKRVSPNELMDKLTKGSELKGFLRKSLEAVQNVLDNEFSGALTIDEKRLKWKEHSTPIESFIHRFVSQGRTKGEDKRRKERSSDADWTKWSHDYVRKDDLHNLVCAYANVRGGDKPSMKALTMALMDSELDVGTTRTTRDPDSISDKGGRVPVYSGIRVDLLESEVPHYFKTLPHQESNQSIFVRSEEDGVELSRDLLRKKIGDLDGGDGVALSDLVMCFDADEGEVEVVLKRMCNEGEVFEVRPGVWKRL